MRLSCDCRKLHVRSGAFEALEKANGPRFVVGRSELSWYDSRYLHLVSLPRMIQKPNKAPEPTARPVTIPAEPGIAPVRAVAHL